MRNQMAERESIEHWTYYGYDRHLSWPRRATTCTVTASIRAAILSPLSHPLSDKGKPCIVGTFNLEHLCFYCTRMGGNIMRYCKWILSLRKTRPNVCKCTVWEVRVKHLNDKAMLQSGTIFQTVAGKVQVLKSIRPHRECLWYQDTNTRN